MALSFGELNSVDLSCKASIHKMIDNLIRRILLLLKKMKATTINSHFSPHVLMFCILEGMGKEARAMLRASGTNTLALFRVQ